MMDASDYSADARDAGGPLAVDASPVAPVESGLLDAGVVAQDASRAVSIPFALSDEFAPSGYMGDSPATIMAIEMVASAPDCNSRRTPGAAGVCYSVRWTPDLGVQDSSWAGCYWQYPPNNWGAAPGKGIAPGATKVSFLAAGGAGGEIIRFKAGGVNTTPSGDTTLRYRDDFSASLDVTLTSSWKRYEIPLNGAAYDLVLGGFAWAATATASQPITFFIDDIKWEK